MKVGAHVIVIAAARFYLPLMALFALVLLTQRPAGHGVGFVAALMFALALALHALVLGAPAAREALPPFAVRSFVGLGLITALCGAALPGFALAAQLVEAGLFVVTAAGLALAFTVLIGRAPTLRDEAL